MLIDIKSVASIGVTILFGWVSHVTKSEVAQLLTILAATTTIIYNCINIYFKLKRKK